MTPDQLSQEQIDLIIGVFLVAFFIVYVIGQGIFGGRRD